MLLQKAIITADDEGGYRVSRASGDAQSEAPSSGIQAPRRADITAIPLESSDSDVSAAAPEKRRTRRRASRKEDGE